MPLSPPVAREKVHTRQIELNGYTREDGLFDIEARLTDTKTFGFSNNDRGWIEAGEPLHGMLMRMTIGEDMVIRSFEAVTEHSPYGICPEIAPNYAKLAGLRIGPGFLRAAGERIGGVHGCTHLRELLQQMGTVAFQTLYPVLAKRKKSDGTARPALLNTCYAYREDGPVVERQWPNYYTGAPSPAAAESP